MNNPIGPLSKKDAASAVRGQDRDSLYLKAILRFPASKFASLNDQGEVRIRNLSAGGLMAETPVRVTRGEPVEINFRSIGWITGHVAWVSEGRIGIAFDYPIDPKDARKSTTGGEYDVPGYLKKLNQPAPVPKLRRS